MGRSPCCDKNGLKKGPWTPEEDQKLVDYINKHGYGNWRTLPQNAGLQRCGKSCRLRWTNYLRPDIKRGKFSFEEEEAIIQLHKILGNKWSAIAARLPGRTDNEIKNYWNTHIRKKLLRMGIDPVTHSPRLDLLDLSSFLSSCLYNSTVPSNFSRLLDLHQSMVNPQLLPLPTSLFSENGNQTASSFLLQNSQQTQLSNPQLLLNNQYQTLGQQLPCSTPLVFCNEEEVMNKASNAEQFPANLGNFSDELSCRQWQTDQNPGLSSDLRRSEESYVPLAPNYDDHNNYYSYHDMMDPSFSNNSNNQNFSFGSSSPTPLNSNSTTYNNINSSSTTTDQDERDSYCSNFINFEIPEILDVNEFM